MRDPADVITKKAAEIPEDLRARLCTYRGWKERIDDMGRKFEASPVLKQLTNDGIELIERIASLTEQLRLSKAAYETNLATAEHNKRVRVNELNAEIRALTEENARLKEDAEAFRFMRKKRLALHSDI